MSGKRCTIDHPLIAWGAFAVLLLVHCFLLIEIQPLSAAWRGGEVMGWIWVTLDPIAGPIDWPTGIRNFDKSLFMNLYHALYLGLGIEPEHAVPVVIVVEVLAVLAVFAWYTRNLVPEMGRGALVLILAYVLASTARDINLAGFGQPFFKGMYYNAADVMRMLGMMFLVQRKYVRAAAAFAVAIAIHPVLGGITCLVSSGILWLHRADLYKQWRQLIIAALVGAGLALPWLFISYSGASLSGGTIPSERWFELTRMMNMHWYPVHTGVFTEEHGARFFPFLAFLGLLVTYWQRPDVVRREFVPVLRIFTAGALLLSVVGVAISVAPPSPLFVKFSFHRGSDLIVLWGLPVVIYGLWRDALDAPWWQRVVAILILITPFLGRGQSAYPAISSLVIILPPLVRSWRSGTRARLPERLLLSVVCGVIVVMALAPGLPHDWWSRGYTGLVLIYKLWGRLAAVAVCVVVVIVLLSVVRRPWAEWGLFGLLMAFAGLWTINLLLDLVNRTQMEDFKATQEWARDHTPRDALFLNDPAQVYGWRDYSRRASAGIPREWLHNAWLYDSDAALYEGGMQRFAEYGLDLEAYLAMGNVSLAGYQALQRDVSLRHNELPDTWRIHMAEQYGIDYFVYARDRIRFESSLPIAFENTSYIVYAAAP